MCEQKLDEISDEEAIVLASKGDEQAFGILYERYVGKIYNYVYYRTGNSMDAEDLTAKVFHRAYHHISRFQLQGVPFSAWLYRIAHNLVANWYRDTSRKKEFALEDHYHLEFSGDLPEAAILKDQESERLLRAIKKLSPERQHLIILKYVEHLSNAEIAIIMKRSEGAVKSLYHRTLESLKNTLEKNE